MMTLAGFGRLLAWVAAIAWIHSVAICQPGRVIILENADNLEGKIIDGQDARELIGNVRFHQENVRVSCDRALQFIASGKVILTGNVVVNDDSLTLRAPRGAYYRDERRAEAFDHVTLDDGSVQLKAGYGEYFIEPKRAFFHTRVVVRDTGSTVTSDSLLYFRTEKRSIATGRVRIVNAADNVTITGNRLDHFSTQQFSRVTGRPIMVQLDSSTPGSVDTLVVRSRVMESYRDSVKRLVAIDSVEIVRSDLAAIAGNVQFFTQADSMLLRQAPVVWYQQTQMTGDSINVYLRKRKLHLVTVMSDAFAASRSDSVRPTRFDQMSGELMRMYFAGKGLERIEVDDRATSLYHLYEDSLANGVNKTSGDHIMVSFGDGKVQAIRILGGVEGQYFPENLVEGREAEYAIAGFLWRTNRPRILPSDVRMVFTEK